MRARLVGLSVVLLASCLAATVAVAQLPPTGAAKLPELVVSAPNLVVAKVVFSHPEATPFATSPALTKVSLTTRNIGTADATPTDTACVFLFNATDPTGLSFFGFKEIPAVAAGAEATIQFEMPPYTSRQILFVCDANCWKRGLDDTHPYGHLRETATGLVPGAPPEAGEYDNAFMVPFDTKAAAPGSRYTFLNPALPPPAGRTRGTVRHAALPPNTGGPDLVIVRATVSPGPAAHPAYAPTLRVSAVIRNLGTVSAAASTLVCLQSPTKLYTLDVTIGGHAATPALKPGAQATVNIDVPAFSRGRLVLVADAPNDWNQPFGKVSENAGLLTLTGTKSAAEWNNAFSFPYDSIWKLPKTFRNYPLSLD